MDPLQHVKKPEMRREGQASDQNKIISMLFFFSPLSLVQSKAEMWIWMSGRDQTVKQFANYVIAGGRESLPACLGHWVYQKHRSDPAGTSLLRSFEKFRVFFQMKLSQELVGFLFDFFSLTFMFWGCLIWTSLMRPDFSDRKIQCFLKNRSVLTASLLKYTFGVHTPKGCTVSESIVCLPL